MGELLVVIGKNIISIWSHSWFLAFSDLIFKQEHQLSYRCRIDKNALQQKYVMKRMKTRSGAWEISNKHEPHNDAMFRKLLETKAYRFCVESIDCAVYDLEQKHMESGDVIILTCPLVHMRNIVELQASNIPTQLKLLKAMTHLNCIVVHLLTVRRSS